MALNYPRSLVYNVAPEEFASTALRDGGRGAIKEQADITSPCSPNLSHTKTSEKLQSRNMCVQTRRGIASVLGPSSSLR